MQNLTAAQTGALAWLALDGTERYRVAPPKTSDLDALVTLGLADRDERTYRRSRGGPRLEVTYKLTPAGRAATR